MSLQEFTKLEHTNFLANFLPQGRAWEAKFVEDSNLRKYLTGKSCEFKRINDLFVTFLSEQDPRTTDIFLDEWESALKIPDNCIPLASTDAERRDNIVLKMASLSVQTEQDFIDLAEQFGFTIEFFESAYPPYNVPFTPTSVSESILFPPFDVPFIPFSIEGGRFTWVVIGNFNSDLTNSAILNCLFEQLIPSNYRVVFVAND